MVSAKDFLEVNVGDGGVDLVLEQKRLVQAVESLSQLTNVAKQNLALELIKVVEDKQEVLIRRVLAATALACNAGRLGIKGEAGIAASLRGVLDNQFVLKNYGPLRQPIGRLNLHPQLTEMEIFFLKDLVRAAFAVDRSAVESTVYEIAQIMRGTETGGWLESILNRTP